MDRNHIQTIFLGYGEAFRNGNHLSAVQIKAMQAIERCSTENAGFHSFICDTCGHTEVAYNSCRNRHCPHCQWLKQEIWIDKVKSTLLPVKYVHIVFTIPEFLNEFVLINHQLIYDILFEASWHALQKCAGSFYGIQTGALSVLHTPGTESVAASARAHAGADGRTGYRRHAMDTFTRKIFPAREGALKNIPGKGYVPIVGSDVQ
jgi:hypothetical protein